MAIRENASFRHFGITNMDPAVAAPPKHVSSPPRFTRCLAPVLVNLSASICAEENGYQ